MKKTDEAVKEGASTGVVLERIVRHFNSLGYTVVAKPRGYFVYYDIYAHEGIECGTEKPLFHKKGSPSYPDPVETVEEADIFAHGDVKWDGCSNWYFDEQDSVMLHGCCKDDVLNIGKILAECWDWTKDICPNWLDM
jgi:hypothetical protein